MQDWQTLTPAQLDDAYANGPYIPNADSYPRAWSLAALAFREAHPPEVIPYGDHPRQQIDLFHPNATPKGLITFLHGGYWRAFDRRDWSHLAAGGLARGYAVALPGYVLTPEATIPQITAMTARAIDTLAAQVPGPLHLTGHSAGGHLVARMIMPDAAPACADRIATCVPISPLADLRPLVPQSMNADLKLTEASATAESPALSHPLPGIKTTTWVGALERPSFHWQAKTLAQAWNHPLQTAPNRHHFDIIEALSDPDSRLLETLLAA